MGQGYAHDRASVQLAGNVGGTHCHPGGRGPRQSGGYVSGKQGTCPVSLIMRYGQRAELRCLKYLRRLRAPVVSPIVRQIDALSVLSHQVKESVSHLGETPTRMPHVRAPCLGLDETGQHSHPSRLPYQPGLDEMSGRPACINMLRPYAGECSHMPHGEQIWLPDLTGSPDRDVWSAGRAHSTGPIQYRLHPKIISFCSSGPAPIQYP